MVKTEKTLSEHWNDFIDELYNLLSSYEIQKDKPVDILKCRFVSKCLTLLKNNYHINTERVNNTKILYDGAKIAEINQLFQFTLRSSPEIKCKIETKTITIKGNFVKLSDLDLNFCKKEITTIEIIAGDTVFIDVDFTVKNSNFSLQIVAPKWSIIGTRVIQLNGTDGDSATPVKATNGAYEGTRGEDGKPGLPGGQGGNFFGIGESFINGINLTIISKGGRGGQGQEGGDGVNGQAGATSTLSDYDKFTYEKIGDTRWRIFGKAGGKGGSGGNGGKGGVGGHPGRIKIFDLGGDNAVHVESRPGVEGAGGRGGRGGPGGKHGKTVEATYIICCWSNVDKIENSDPLSDGEDGIANENDVGRLLPEKPQMKEFRNIISNFNILLRNNLKMIKVIKERSKSFLKKLNRNTHVIDHLSFDGLVNEYKELENQFDHFSKNHIELFPCYEYLLDAVERVSSNLDQNDKDEKIVLSHLYTTLLTKMNLIDDTINENIITKVGVYLKITTDELRYIKSEGEEIVFYHYHQASTTGIKRMVQDFENFIQKFVIKELDTMTDKTTKSVLKIIAEFLKSQGNINKHLNEILAKTYQVSKSLFLENIPAIRMPSDEIHSVKFLVERLKRTISNNEDIAEHSLGKSIRDSVITLADRINEDIDRFKTEITTQKLVNLDVTKWQVPIVLKRIKFYTKQLNQDESSNVLEAINSMIFISEILENYYRQKKLSDYINHVIYLKSWPLKLRNTNFSDFATKLRDDIALNLILHKHEAAVNCVKQFAFPYVESIFDRYKLKSSLLQENDANKLLERSITSLESLNYTLFRAILPIDQYRMISSGYDYDHPFFTWNHKDHNALFSKLFAGEEILLKADPRMYHKFGVKFTWIRMVFKAVNESYQEMIDNTLKFHSIALTHTGNSYYRCGKKIYLITTGEAIMDYRHTKRGEKIWDENVVYMKVHDGNPILSPFTTWKLQIIENYNDPDSFLKLTKFHEMVDLELVGREDYFDESDSLHVCNDNIEKFYELDEPFRLPELQDEIRSRRDLRNTDFVACNSAASSFSSPLNSLFNWMSFPLTSSIAKITYLGSFASKPIDILPEQFTNPILFFDQINSLLVLAPLLLYLGNSFFEKRLKIEETEEKRLQFSRVKTWKSFVVTFGNILLKYNLNIKWLHVSLEDINEDIEIMRGNGGAEDLELRLVTLLTDFLEDIEYDPAFNKVKCDKNFIFDVNNLIELAQKVPSFEKKIRNINK